MDGIVVGYYEYSYGGLNDDGLRSMIRWQIMDRHVLGTRRSISDSLSMLDRMWLKLCNNDNCILDDPTCP